MILPRTLIQLHYHDRTGGVSTVVRSYARAFRHLTGAPRECSLVLCHSSNDAHRSEDAIVYNVQVMEYREFGSLEEFLDCRQVIQERLERLLIDPRLPKPIAVVGHNLTLGKNCAVSSAFARIARAWKGSFPAVRFYSVIHDFAEEGRTEMLRRIDALETAGAGVLRDFYVQSPNLRYVVLNKRDCAILTKAGMSAMLLPNPVDVDKNVQPLAPADARGVERALAAVALDDGIVLRHGAPWYFYPARVIARKNVVESIILACILLRGNLLLGVAGTSTSDRDLYRRILRLCRRHRLAVILDAPRIGAHLPRRLSSENPFGLLYGYADACVTTSLAEGFGYALYEPWLYGKRLLGRLPLGFSRRDPVDFSSLYRALPIPAAWVDVERLSRKYLDMRGRINPACRVTSCDPRSVVDALVKNGMIDFAALDLKTQLSVAERLARGETVPGEVRAAWNRQHRRIMQEATGSNRLVAANRRTVRREFNSAAFERKFAFCLTSRITIPRKRIYVESIRRHFADGGGLRLLMDLDR